MSKRDKPEDVFRRGFKNFGDRAPTFDDLASVLGFIVEKSESAESLLWRHLEVVRTAVGLVEREHKPDFRFSKGTVVRRGSDLFVARRSTAAPLDSGSDWMPFPNLPAPPERWATGDVERKPEKAAAVVKRTRITKHDERGRVVEFETVEERPNE